MIKEQLYPRGVYTIESIDKRTGKVLSVEKQNVVCQGFIDGIWDFLDYTAQTPAASALDLTYFAAGEGTTPAARADTTLETEYFRKALSFKGFTSAKFTAKASIDAAEGNPTGDNITEVGIFAGGSIAADSGTLISRAIVSIPKNSNIKLLVTWTLTI